MAVLESENFAVYSNIEFLYLIGKYAAQSKSYSVEGLKSLNDYLIILDYTRNNQKEAEYCRKRILGLYQAGVILHNNQEFIESKKYFSAILKDLQIYGLTK